MMKEAIASERNWIGSTNLGGACVELSSYEQVHVVVPEPERLRMLMHEHPCQANREESEKSPPLVRRSSSTAPPSCPISFSGLAEASSSAHGPRSAMRWQAPLPWHLHRVSLAQSLARVGRWRWLGGLSAQHSVRLDGSGEVSLPSGNSLVFVPLYGPSLVVALRYGPSLVSWHVLALRRACPGVARHWYRLSSPSRGLSCPAMKSISLQAVGQYCVATAIARGVIAMAADSVIPVAIAVRPRLWS